MAYLADGVDPLVNQAMTDAFTKIAARGDNAPMSEDAYFSLLKQQPQNQPSAPVATPQIHATPVSAPESSSMLLSNLDKMAEEAYSLQDSGEAYKRLGSLIGELEREDSRFIKEARLSAYTEMNIAKLEQIVQQSVLMDDHSPGFRQKYGNIDSAETEQAKAALTKAKVAADSSIKEKLLENPVYQEMKAKGELVKKVLATKTMSGMTLDEKKQAEADEFALTLGKQGKENAALILPPEFSANPRGLLGYIRGRSQKEGVAMLEALKATPEETLGQAFKGNVFARQILEKREGALLGADARVLLKEGYAIADTNAEAQRAMTEMSRAGVGKYATLSDIDKKAYARLLAPSSMDLTEDKAQHQAAGSAIRSQIAQDYLKFKDLRNFNSDMGKIVSDEKTPAFLQALIASKSGKAVSLKETKRAAREAPTTEQAQRQIQELTNWYASAAKKRDSSSLFKIEPFEVEKLRTEAAMSRLEKFFIGAGIPGLVPDYRIPMSEAAIATGLPKEKLWDYDGKLYTKQEYDTLFGNAYYRNSPSEPRK